MEPPWHAELEQQLFLVGICFMGVNWNREIHRKTPPGMVQTASLGGRRDMFFLCFCINNWRSIQRNLFCLPMRCKMLHETQSLEWPEAFKWALLDTPHELDREQRGGPWPPWGPLPVWRRRLYAAGLNEF